MDWIISAVAGLVGGVCTILLYPRYFRWLNYWRARRAAREAEDWMKYPQLPMGLDHDLPPRNHVGSPHEGKKENDQGNIHRV